MWKMTKRGAGLVKLRCWWGHCVPVSHQGFVLSLRERLVRPASATRHVLSAIIFRQLNVRADNDFTKYSILSSTEDHFPVMYELFKGNMTGGLGKRV